MTECRMQNAECRRLGFRRHEVTSRVAFTLIELLVVIAIIMMLMGLLMPAFNMARQFAKKTKAKSEVKQLEVAWKGVLSDYRRWSSAGAPIAANGAQQVMVQPVVDYLAGANSKGIVYMEFDGSSTNTAGAMVDPWYNGSKNPNNLYKVALGDSLVTPPQVTQPLYRNVATWSMGPDGLDDAAHKADDAKSWE